MEGPAAEGHARNIERVRDYRNHLAIGVTVAILAVLTVAIAIDFSSVPSLAVLSIVLIGGLIAALVTWG